MGDRSNSHDLYEVLQISPNADFETVERVFRHLAKKLHPDNHLTGSEEKFRRLSEAYSILSNPEKRAEYDSQHSNMELINWRIADEQQKESPGNLDRVIRAEILHFLYVTRRRDPDNPGVGFWQVLKVLGCSEQHLQFHIWYLKEKTWIKMDENGMYTITASGVDQVERFADIQPKEKLLKEKT